MSLPTTVAWHAAPPQPAYHAVPARRTLAMPAPAKEQPAPSSAPKAKKVDWPEPVRAYVRRAFDPDNQIEGVSTAAMQEKLKQTISWYAERQMHEGMDWANYPLPQQIIKTEREKAERLNALAMQSSTNAPHPSYVKSGVTNNQSLQSSQSKRKSADMEHLQPAENESSNPPWRKANLQDRMTYGSPHKDKRQKKNNIPGPSTSKSDMVDKEKRKQRFGLATADTSTTPPWRSPRPDTDSEMPTGPVVGTNQSLEKSYFRLTAPPKAETVRPQHVLEKTLALLRKKWKEDKNYNYICNQFKSLRQDLTVQHIKNAFTVKVYEIHARIALEKGDLGEYNQCQTQLRALYMQKLGGNPAEFLGYRILYFVYTCNKTDMNDLLAELTPADKAEFAVKHALGVRSSLALGNYHRFFRLYLEAPNMGAYLMDMFIERERLHALANISRAYLSVPLRFLTDELGFENDGECQEFIQLHGGENLIEDKATPNGSQRRVKVKEGAATFESLRAAAFSKVDIKGQI